MSDKLFERYGAITEEDAQVLESCLTELSRRGSTVRMLEIGAHDGGTALGVKAWCEAHGLVLEYWGIEPDTCRRDFSWGAGCTVIRGDSAEMFSQVPDCLSLVWVDGCHCFNHVALDTLHYAPRVAVGGFICYHDINPAGAGKDHQYHGPDVPEFGLSVNQALEALRFPWDGWDFFEEKIPADRHDCGTRAFRRYE